MARGSISRRQFMVKSAHAAGVYAAAKTVRLDTGAHEWARLSGQTVAPSDRVRFGMIGVGMQGSGLLGTSIQLPGVECAAACDLYDGRHALAREIAGANLPTTRRYQELLENKDIDCIVAAVPDHWHRQVVLDAVSAGKDIYCEKPMSHTAADGVAMVAGAKKSGKIVQIGSQRVSSAIVAKAKELLAQGVIGDLCLVEGVNGRNSPCGAWEYPPPPDLSLENLDWDTWQGTVPRRTSRSEGVCALALLEGIRHRRCGGFACASDEWIYRDLGEKSGAESCHGIGRHPALERRPQHAGCACGAV